MLEVPFNTHTIFLKQKQSRAHHQKFSLLWSNLRSGNMGHHWGENQRVVPKTKRGNSEQSRSGPWCVCILYEDV